MILIDIIEVYFLLIINLKYTIFYLALFFIVFCCFIDNGNIINFITIVNIIIAIP